MAGALRSDWGPSDVLTLTIDRPDQRNAVDPELLTALAEHLRKDGERAAAVILRGAGSEAFSAGYDISRLTGTSEDLASDQYLGEAAAALRACPAPVIARLQGHCHGAGVELALNCDLRIASEDLKMSVPAVSLGVVYRFQFVARLVQICGIARAADLLLAMPQLDASQAYTWGLVSEVVPAEQLDGRIGAITERLASAPRPAVRGTKASLRLIEDRALAADDVAAAHTLRAAAAGSPERRDAIKRRQESLGRRKH